MIVLLIVLTLNLSSVFAGDFVLRVKEAKKITKFKKMVEKEGVISPISMYGRLRVLTSISEKVENKLPGLNKSLAGCSYIYTETSGASLSGVATSEGVKNVEDSVTYKALSNAEDLLAICLSTVVMNLRSDQFN